MSDELPLIRPSGYLSAQRLRDEQFAVMRRIVQRLEWSGRLTSCPICKALKPGPHGVSCDIGKVLDS